MAALNEGNEPDTDKEEYYPYQLVKFFTTNKDGEADIDCVPSTWVTFNITTGKCECKYVPPPYNKDSFQLLHDFVKKQVLPPESWPSHPMTIQGHAKNYAEALKRLEVLRQEDYAYTTSDNNSKSEKAAATTKQYRTRVVKGNAKVVRKLTQVPEINTSSGESCSGNASDENSDLSNEVSPRESEDDKENDKTTAKNNRKKAKRNDKNDENKQDRSDFPSDQDYVREVPTKSLKSAGKKANLRTSAVKPSASQNLHISGAKKDPSAGKKKGSDSSVSRVVSSSSQKQTDVPVSTVASLRSKEGGDASVLPVASSNSIDTNPTGLTIRTNSPTKSPAAVNKETKRSLKSAIDGLRYDVQQMTQEFKELKGIVQKSALAQDVYGANVQSFASEYEVSLPMKTMEDFKAFEGRLETEKKFRKEFTATLHYLVDSRSTLSKNITGILKKHLTRELALNFTAVKASGNKTIFKNTFFCKCMLEVSRLKLKTIEKDVTIPITEKLYFQELGNALSNAFDWDGKRKERPRRKVATVNPAEQEINKEPQIDVENAE